jgi:hypothetical protein
MNLEKILNLKGRETNFFFFFIKKVCHFAKSLILILLFLIVHKQQNQIMFLQNSKPAQYQDIILG